MILFWVLLSIKNLDIQNNETQNLSSIDNGCMFNIMINNMVTFFAP